jgi:hypothetical protein
MWRDKVVIGMAGALIACQPTMTRQERAVEEQALQARTNGWAKAFSNRQTDSLATYYEQSDLLRVGWPDGQRTSSWQEESAKQQEFFAAASQVNLVVQDLAVEINSPTMATTTFRHAMDVILGGLTPPRRYFTGLGTLVWTRENARASWVIHAGQISETPGATPAR